MSRVIVNKKKLSLRNKLSMVPNILKADRPHLRYYPYMLPGYRQTKTKDLRLVMTLIALVSQLFFYQSIHTHPETNKRMDGRTDGRTDVPYQVHYLPASPKLHGR